MKVTLRINYRTFWGQSIAVSGSISELGLWDKSKALSLTHHGNGDWVGEVELSAEETFEYKYIVTLDGEFSMEEFGQNHQLVVNKGDSDVVCYDIWFGFPPNKQYFSSAFTKCLFSHGLVSEPRKFKHNLCLRLFAPQIRSHESVGIVGGNEQIGDWNDSKVILLNPNRFPEWSINLDLSQVKSAFEYKFVVVDTQTRTITSFDGGGNRYFDHEKVSDGVSISMDCGYLVDHQTPWKGAGLAIPIFSIRSEESFGIGDFADLKLLVDWAELTCQKVIQILPINDTTMTYSWTDSYPYNANSIFALHPNYASLKQMGTLKDETKRRYFDAAQISLNSLTDVDYDGVTKLKWEYFNLIFAQDGVQTLASEEFKIFFAENEDWLVDYGAFCFLRDVNKSPIFGAWEKYSVYNRDEIAEFAATNYHKIAIHYFIQYHLDRQLKASKAYADEKKIVFKGDIPIGISPNSVEAWAEPHLFNMNTQAGAPPDDFSVLGQNWGFPTYNWEEMEKDGYLWWRKRFNKMEKYFNAYRIDHILGFFRIWEIPKHSVQGLLGYFNPAMPFSHYDLSQRGFNFNFERHVNPFILHYMLAEIFGVFTDEVIKTFLFSPDLKIYHLKSDFDTQRKVEAYFMGRDSEKDNLIRDGLYSLHNEVLFVQDPHHPDLFHPRITAQHTHSFRNLSDYDRWKFDQIYLDFFYHRHNNFWAVQATKKLPALINSTDMLCCAEDLGMIPDCVPEVMRQLQILSLEIQRMPKDPKAKFGVTNHYPYLSVCTTSTHDMSTNRGWWNENRELAQEYYNKILHETGEAPMECEPWVAERIIVNHLYSPSILAIFPLQDLLALDGSLCRKNAQEEQINMPSNPKHYWRYRMHLTIEELLKADAFNAKLKDVIKNSGRDSIK